MKSANDDSARNNPQSEIRLLYSQKHHGFGVFFEILGCLCIVLTLWNLLIILIEFDFDITLFTVRFIESFIHGILLIVAGAANIHATKMCEIRFLKLAFICESCLSLLVIGTWIVEFVFHSKNDFSEFEFMVVVIPVAVICGMYWCLIIYHTLFLLKEMNHLKIGSRRIAETEATI